MDFLKKCKCQKITKILMAFSVFALIITVLVSVLDWDLWLAGTQWILISILFAVYALHIENCHRSNDE